MKKILFLILTFLFFFWISNQKQNEIIPIIKEVPEINFLDQPINLNLSPIYNFEDKEEELIIPLNPMENENIIPSFIQIGKCHSIIDTPDKLSNKLSPKTNKNQLNEIDCGIIQTTFPLSF